jgi:hypothetical protein
MTSQRTRQILEIAWRAASGLVLGAILVVTASLINPSSARADTLQIAGAGFIRHCPCDDLSGADHASVDNGILKPEVTNTHYYAPVVFPRDGETVCSFSLVYRDVNANDTMTVRLERKLTNGSPSLAPKVMAQVKTGAGTLDKMRVSTTTNIVSPTIDTENEFYFVEALVPTFNLGIVGVRIVVKPVCP